MGTVVLYTTYMIQLNFGQQILFAELISCDKITKASVKSKKLRSN